MRTVGRRIEKDGVHRPEEGWYIYLLSENSTQMNVMIMPELQTHMCLTYGGGSRKQLALRHCRIGRRTTWILDFPRVTPPENGEGIKAIDSSIRNGGDDFDRVWKVLEGYDLNFVGRERQPSPNYAKTLKYVAASQVDPSLLARMIELSAFRPTASYNFVNPLSAVRLQKLVDRKLDQRRGDPAATGSVDFSDNDKGWKELHWCVHWNFPNLAKFLLEKDPSRVDKRDKNGSSVFELAIKYNHAEFARMLLREKFVNFSGEAGGKTSVYYAARQRNLVLTKVLVAEGANTELIKNNDSTALHWCASRGYVEIGRALLARADVNAKTKVGSHTPLHVACFDNNTKFVELLLEFHANVSVLNKDGFYSIHMAARRGKVEMGKMLIQRQESLKEIKDNGTYGNTPLHWAAYSGNIDFTRYLIGLGVNLNTKNRFQQTAKEVAKEKDHKRILFELERSEGK